MSTVGVQAVAADIGYFAVVEGVQGKVHSGREGFDRAVLKPDVWSTGRICSEFCWTVISEPENCHFRKDMG